MWDISEQRTDSGPNLDLVRPRIPEILKRKPSTSSDEIYQLLRTQLGKQNHYTEQKPRQFNHSLSTSPTAL